MNKSNMTVEMMANAMQNETVINRRYIYEDDDICVVQQFSEFASGDKEATMVVSLKKDGLVWRTEIGARHSSNHLCGIGGRTQLVQPCSQAT
jgi:hypothetical protein